MSNKNIALIGFMGAGKSTVAIKLARLLKRKVLSTDKIVREKAGKTIPQIFKQLGEAHFRKLERAAIRDLRDKKNSIIDCGGGIILNPANIKDLKRNSILIHVSVSPEVVYKRIKKQKNRPLLKVPNPKKRIKELLSERLSLYKEAHYSVNGNYEDVMKTCKEIIAIVSDE